MAIARYTLSSRSQRTRECRSNGEQTADFIQCVAFDRSGRVRREVFSSGNKARGHRTSFRPAATPTRMAREFIRQTWLLRIRSLQRARQQVQVQTMAVTDRQWSQSRPEPASAVASGFMNIPDGVEDEGLPFN